MINREDKTRLIELRKIAHKRSDNVLVTLISDAIYLTEKNMNFAEEMEYELLMKYIHYYERDMVKKSREKERQTIKHIKDKKAV